MTQKAKLVVKVQLSEDKNDWGYPLAKKLIFVWTKDEIEHDKKKIPEKDFNYTGSEEEIVYDRHHGQTITHIFMKEESGFINVFMLQHSTYYRIGEKNILISIDQIPTENATQWEKAKMSLSTNVEQLADNWLLVKAFGSNYNDFNTCGYRATGPTRPGRQLTEPFKISNVKTLYDCTLFEDPLFGPTNAFDYDENKHECHLYYGDWIFHPAITSNEGRDPSQFSSTKCYMRKSTYDHLKWKYGNNNTVLVEPIKAESSTLLPLPISIGVPQELWDQCTWTNRECYIDGIFRGQWILNNPSLEQHFNIV